MTLTDCSEPGVTTAPGWLVGHGGDTRDAHKANVSLIEKYLGDLRSSGRGLPANTRSPKQVAMALVAEESGVKLISLTRSTSRCRAMVEAAAKGLDGKKAIHISVRMLERVRPVYSIDEMINIATAVIQARCEIANTDHRADCRRTEDLLKRIARSFDDGLKHDCADAIKVALQDGSRRSEESELLAEIDTIRTMATQGSLELATFHGRLKLEAALRGFGVGAVANFTEAATQTVINWASGLKSPTLMYKNDIAKIETALELRAGYLSEVHVCHRSGPSNVKQYHLPPEVRDMPAWRQKEFRRLIDPTINLRDLQPKAVAELMQRTLEIFEKSRDTDDVKRAKLRVEMTYALPELPHQIAKEFGELVEQRRDVLLMGIVPNKKRGWDDETIEIYRDRFRLFFGWLHNHLGVPLKNLSLAYLAFPQILQEYMIYLVERKVTVGLEMGFSAAAREWYVFAGSLTRGRLGSQKARVGSAHYDDEDDDEESIDAGEPLGWLRDQRKLLDHLVPIPALRRRDQLNPSRVATGKVRQILVAKSIAKARIDWLYYLEETTGLYRSWRKEHEGNEVNIDSTARVSELLTWEYPLDAIEIGAQSIRDYIEKRRAGSSRWSTAVRGSVTLKLHAQIPLRRKTFCALTYNSDNTGMVQKIGGEWWVIIPESAFKNAGTKAFQTYIANGFFRKRLLDEWGLYQDLVDYVEIARPAILGGADSPAFYVARDNAGHVSPETFAGQFRLLTRYYIAENPGTGTGIPGVREFGSHAMRHLVATAVWKMTGSVHAAAAAILDSESVTKRHYRKIVEGEEQRLAMMSKVMAGQNDRQRRSWPKYGEILPRIASPSIATIPKIQMIVDEDVR